MATLVLTIKIDGQIEHVLEAAWAHVGLPEHENVSVTFDAAATPDMIDVELTAQGELRPRSGPTRLRPWEALAGITLDQLDLSSAAIALLRGEGIENVQQLVGRGFLRARHVLSHTQEEAQLFEELAELRVYPLDDAGFGTRAYNCLARSYNTVNHLASKTQYELDGIPNLGRRTLEEIITIMRERYGVVLPEK